MEHVVIFVHITAVAKNVMLELHLRHEFNNIIFKIKSNIYIYIYIYMCVCVCVCVRACVYIHTPIYKYNLRICPSPSKEQFWVAPGPKHSGRYNT
jgi:hypothetical protein